MKFINELKRIRQEQKVSIKTLAAKSGIHKRTIENWEYRGFTPTLDKFEEALSALGYELKICKKEQ